MPFSSTGSVTSTTLDNMLRGLYRDNADHTVTGTAAETTMASTSITGSTIGATGAIHVLAAGTISGTNDTKDIRLKLGSTTIATVARNAAGTQDWVIDAWCFNTAANAQRWMIVRSTASALTTDFDYATSAEDTSTTLTLAVTGDLANTADSIVQTSFDVFIVQVS